MLHASAALLRKYPQQNANKTHKYGIQRGGNHNSLYTIMRRVGQK